MYNKPYYYLTCKICDTIIRTPYLNKKETIHQYLNNLNDINVSELKFFKFFNNKSYDITESINKFLYQ